MIIIRVQDFCLKKKNLSKRFLLFARKVRLRT